MKPQPCGSAYIVYDDLSNQPTDRFDQFRRFCEVAVLGGKGSQSFDICAVLLDRSGTQCDDACRVGAFQLDIYSARSVSSALILGTKVARSTPCVTASIRRSISRETSALRRVNLLVWSPASRARRRRSSL